MSDELIKFVIEDGCKLSAYNDLLAMMLAELAALDNDPKARLAYLCDSERNAVYSVVATDDSDDASKDRTRRLKAQAKEEVFALASNILGRIIALRSQ